MTTTTQTTSPSPLVARWELVPDVRGRTRPQMRWEIADAHEAHEAHETAEVLLAA